MKPSKILAALSFFLVSWSRAASAQEIPKVGFDSAVKEAIKNNPQAMKAREQVERADALMRQARSGSFPTLVATGLYTRLDGDRTANLNGMQRVLLPANSVNAQITVAVPLINAQRWVSWLHAGDQIDVAKATAADVARSIALATGRAYLTVVAQHRLVVSSAHARDTAKAHLEFAQGRLGAGIGNKIDEVRAAQQLAVAELQVQVVNLALLRTQEALGVLVGVNGPLDAGSEPTLVDVTGPPEALIASRTDVIAAKERWTAAKRVRRDGWTDYLPTLTGSFAPFYQEPSSFTVPQTGWSALLLLSIPLYDGGFRYGAQRERASLDQQAHLDYDGTLLLARSELRTAFASVRIADDGLKAAQDNAKFAQQALELAQTAYRAGATTNLELIDAQRVARDSETGVAEAEDVARQARLDLLAASGRFP
jgi:outer membrane protein TolC